jgi:hypothetical protein
MPVTEAQRRASRLNGAKSKGPSEAGRTISRANALKHGLTATVVVPGEDAAEVQRRSETLHRQLNPATDLGGEFVDLLARLFTRHQRCARHEDAALAYRVRHAQQDFDDARCDAAEADYAALDATPAVSVRRLSRTAEGVDCLARGWRSLLGQLLDHAPEEWYRRHVHRIDALQGRGPGEFPTPRATALALAVGGDFTCLDEGDGAGLSRADRQHWAKVELTEWMICELERLEALREELAADPVVAQDRAEAGERALFDPSPEAARARRYAAETERGIFRTLREFRRVEAEAAATHCEDETCEAPGSFCQGAETAAAEADPPPEPPAAAAVPPAAAVPVGAGRPAEGSVAFVFDPPAAPVASVPPAPRSAAAGPRAG